MHVMFNHVVYDFFDFCTRKFHAKFEEKQRHSLLTKPSMVDSMT